MPVLRASVPASSSWAVTAGRNSRLSAVPPAEEQRVDPEPQLVEQAVLEQGVGERPEPVLHDVLAGLLLQVADRPTGRRPITVVLCHSGSASVVETTYLAMVLIRSL